MNVPVAYQNQAIAAATTKHKVPLNVFLGMYSVETASGSNVTNSSAGAVGPFQFTGPDKGTGVLYPMTNNPTPAQFAQQADAAAALLRTNYNSTGSWTGALAAYNAGLGNVSAGLGYASLALQKGAALAPGFKPGSGTLTLTSPTSTSTRPTSSSLATTTAAGGGNLFGSHHSELLYATVWLGALALGVMLLHLGLDRSTHAARQRATATA